MKNIFEITAKWLNKISPKLYIGLYYIYNRKKLPNLKKPQNISEIILSNIFSGKINNYADYVDKIKVRDFYKKMGYEKYLPKIYGVWEKVENINFDQLPNSFVLKTNNGCGGHYFCRNKKLLNKIEAEKTIRNALRKNETYSKLETQYNKIKPLIYAEEFIQDGILPLPIDYKFLCLDGKILLILTVERNKNNMKLATYDTSWNKLNYVTPKYSSNMIHKKPNNLPEMIEIAENISKHFDFVRVDFFDTGGKLFLGELTFTPAAGIMSYFTTEAINKMSRCKISPRC